MTSTEGFLCEAIELAHDNVASGGRPFGAVVVRNGAVVARGVNETHLTNDPTAHAEMTALREAAQALGSPRLEGCIVYASGHPCPMCLAAMQMAGIGEVVYAYSNEDGAPFGLSTAEVYAEMAKPLTEHVMRITHVPARPAGRPDLYAAWRAASREAS